MLSNTLFRRTIYFEKRSSKREKGGTSGEGNLYPFIHNVILGSFLTWSLNLYSWKCNLYYPRTQLLIQESQKTPACRYTARENPNFEVFFPYSRSKHGEILEMGTMNQISPHLSTCLSIFSLKAVCRIIVQKINSKLENSIKLWPIQTVLRIDGT